jgi:hypothetical protein
MWKPNVFAFLDAVEGRPTVKIEDYVNKEFLVDYFGLATTVENDIFYSPDGDAAVKFSSTQEITKKEFEVLKRFL